MIAIDIGNTKTAIRFFRDGVGVGTWRLGTLPIRTSDEYRIFLNACFSPVGESISSSGGMIVASVVPAASEEVLQLKNEIDIHLVNFRTPLSFELAVPEPKTLGADRIANLEGALRKYGAPVVILDIGTATTLSVIDSKRRFVGGAIAPGFGISAEALFSKTAALSPVDLVAPERAIGRTTEEAMRSGILHGHARMIDGLVAQVREELSEIDAPLIATGGGIPRISPLLKTRIKLDPDLTLAGLQFLFENITKGVPRA